ncbi:cx9C motif-containing protein 4-like [Teleopsis dalmanni]|uniref:cx9C motif-containing protein 4-like n=1 Tax=Teleopsis dalmanni TaxID=139649 RepID=UPI0018CCE03E|nr:cx9C motif-containing protein 4-like [Teleopsis dalmanni]
MPKRKDPCQDCSCRIQSCLQANKYQESKCLYELEQMRLCCVKWHEESMCCSGINLERTYLDGKTCVKETKHKKTK